MTSDIGSAPRHLLDPEAADLVPFDDLTAEVLDSLRVANAVEVPLSEAVERSDAVSGDPDAPVTQQCMHNMEEWLRRQLGADR